MAITTPMYLKRKDSDKETSIFCRISYGVGQPLKYYLPESIHPQHWNAATQRARENKKFPEYPAFNTRLDKIEAGIKTAIRDYYNEHEALPTHEELKALLDKRIKHVDNEAVQHDLLTFFSDIIDRSKRGIRTNKGKPISAGTIKSYNQAFKRLDSFSKYWKRPLRFADIDSRFYNDYVSYMTEVEKLQANTIGKQIQYVKLVMNEAAISDLHVNNKHSSFDAINEDADSIYLSEDEIKDLAAVDLSNDPRLMKVRDLFIIGCRTGLRFSDLSTLTPEKINNGYIEIAAQVKTGKPVSIPVHSEVRRLLDQYGGQLPQAISNQKTNTFLKDLAAKVGSLQKTVTIKYTKAGKRVTETIEKHKLVTTHTARRSFATNEYKAGTPTLIIMAITGHRTERAFLRYIRITPKEHATSLLGIWADRAEKQAQSE